MTDEWQTGGSLSLVGDSHSTTISTVHYSRQFAIQAFFHLIFEPNFPKARERSAKEKKWKINVLRLLNSRTFGWGNRVIWCVAVQFNVMECWWIRRCFKKCLRELFKSRKIEKTSEEPMKSVETSPALILRGQSLIFDAVSFYSLRRSGKSIEKDPGKILEISITRIEDRTLSKRTIRRRELNSFDVLRLVSISKESNCTIA